MENEGAIAPVSRGQYGLPKIPTKVQGILRVNPKGFGFFEVDGREQDFYVISGNMGTALDGDVVLAGLSAPARGDRRHRAEVLVVGERSRERTVGRLWK